MLSYVTYLFKKTAALLMQIEIEQTFTKNNNIHDIRIM